MAIKILAMGFCMQVFRVLHNVLTFVFTDIEFINNLNISAVKIGDKNTIDVRIVILI
jgi:hypothetical protein